MNTYGIPTTGISFIDFQTFYTGCGPYCFDQVTVPAATALVAGEVIGIDATVAPKTAVKDPAFVLGDFYAVVVHDVAANAATQTIKVLTKACAVNPDCLVHPNLTDVQLQQVMMQNGIILQRETWSAA